MPLRRLTRVEYANTVRDLLQEGTGAAALLPPDRSTFHVFYTPHAVSGTEIDRYREAAEQIAGDAVTRLGKILPCDPATTGEAPCARQFIERFGRRAYRRPLTATEIAALESHHTSARRELGLDFAGGVRVLLEAMLQSPRFLYRWELGDAPAAATGGLVRLTGYERASRLSFFLTQSTPDDALLDAAGAGRLDSADGIAAEAQRLLADAGRRRGFITTFFTRLLELEELEALSRSSSTWTAARDSALAETAAFVDGVLGADRSLKTLLTAPFTFGDEALAKLYGATAAGAGARRIELDPAQRAGLFTQAAFLATQAEPSSTNPIRRGKLLREHLIGCQPLPPPPPGLNADLPAPSTKLPFRAQLEQHRADPSCAGCHALIDPLGFAFERYDNVGRYRTKDDGGHPVDASGALDFGDGAKKFDDAVGLMKLLAERPEVHACFARQVFRFALGREEAAADAAALASLTAAFQGDGLDVRALLLSVVRSPSFLHRSPNPGEVLK